VSADLFLICKYDVLCSSYFFELILVFMPREIHAGRFAVILYHLHSNLDCQLCPCLVPNNLDGNQPGLLPIGNRLRLYDHRDAGLECKQQRNLEGGDIPAGSFSSACHLFHNRHRRKGHRY
jgi:hypothetical protein